MTKKNRHKIGQGSGTEVQMEDVILDTEGTPQEIVEWLQEHITEPEQYFRTSYFRGKRAVLQMENYIEHLRREGLDIGKGNALYGYRMPLSEEGRDTRELHIFRRRK